MKFSIYTSCIVLDDRRILLFNAFSHVFVMLKDVNFDIKGHHPEELLKTSPQLYYQLMDAGIIIDDTFDELSKLKQIMLDADNNETEYILHINPTLDCNFNCWYCYEKHMPGSKMDAYMLDAIKMFITNTLKDTRIIDFKLGFFGGEPLLYFNKIAKELISHTNDVCTQNGQKLHINFTSNGSLLNDNQIKFLSRFSCGFQITLDGYANLHNRTRFYRNGKGSYEIITRNIIKLIEAKISVIVRVNYTNANAYSLYKVLDSFKHISENKKKYICFDFQKVWQDKITEDTADEIQTIRTMYREHGFTVLANYLNHDIRQSCYGDKINHILINYQGDLFGCTARDFTRKNRIGYIDNQGIANYDKYKMCIRKIAKLYKPICQRCRIAPICGGGCKQRATESLEYEGCSMGYSEDEIDSKILDIFEYDFMRGIKS